MNNKRTFSVSALVSTALMVAIFQLMDMLSYGGSMFARDDPSENATVKNLGMLCYIYSTMLSQLLFNYLSRIDAAIVSGVIVESLPFMQASIGGVIARHTKDIDGYFTNFLVVFILCSLGFGLASLLLKHGRAGHLISLIPRAVVNGCLGAIGLAQFPVGWGVIVSGRFGRQCIPLVCAAVAVAAVLFLLQQRWPDANILIPLYTFVVVVLFYVLSLLLGISTARLRDGNWLAAREGRAFYPNYVYARIRPSSLRWRAVAGNLLNILTVIFFNSVHIAVNLPAYRVSTGIDFDFSSELGTQGIANIFTVIPCYFVACYSIALYKAGGVLKMYGYVSALAMVPVAVFGLMVRGYIPTFVLSMLPFVMGAGFVYGSFYEPLFTVSPLEYITSLVVCMICCATDQYIIGVAVGLAVCVAHYVVASQRKIAPAGVLGVKETDRLHVVVVDYMLCFWTAQRFVLPERADVLVVDLTRCPGIDWLGMDLVAGTCERAQKVYVVGRPPSMRVRRLTGVPGMVLARDYDDLRVLINEDV